MSCGIPIYGVPSVCGLSGLDRWFVAYGGSAFCSHLAFCCPLFSGFHADFCLWFFSFSFLLCLSLLRSVLFPLWLLLSLWSLPYLAPVAPVTFSYSLAPSAAPHGFIAHSLTFLSPAGSSSLPLVLRAPPVFSASSLSISSCQAFPGGVLVLLRGSVRSLFLVLSLLLSRLLLFSVPSLGTHLLQWWFLQLLSLRLSVPPLMLRCFIWVLLRRLLPLLLLFFWFFPSLLQLGSRGCSSGRLASRCGLGGSCCCSRVCAV